MLCEKCLAVKGPNLKFHEHYFGLFGDTAGWRDTKVSFEACLASKVANGTASPFLAVPGWELDQNLEDILHNVFLGHGRCAVGNAIGEEGTVPPSSGEPRKSMEHLDNELHIWCRKAWEVRILTRYICAIEVYLCEHGGVDRHSQLRMPCGGSQTGPMCSTRVDGERERAKFAGDAYLLSYDALSAGAVSAGRRLFDHLNGETYDHGWNPRYAATFAMEDFGGRVAALSRYTATSRSNSCMRR